VLALSKDCHFCQESVGFYQRLTAFRNTSPQGLRMVAVLPQSKEESANYLKEHGIGADEVVSMEVSKLGVSETPTLLLLDGQNKLEEMWVGMRRVVTSLAYLTDQQWNPSPISNFVDETRAKLVDPPARHALTF
jgi:hypothetical protein